MNEVEDSIFTRIIKGEIDCHKVYEDEYALAFMDIHPIQPGHVLVVPKVQVGVVWDLTEKQYTGLLLAVQRVGKRLRDAFPESERIGVQIEGLEATDHAHIKVFPFSTSQQFHHLPDPNIEPDHTALAELAAKLRFEDLK